ncbi:MAG: hypothetical protein U0105_26035 [Candidatus Obscuribacterales bacterium]
MAAENALHFLRRCRQDFVAVRLSSLMSAAPRSQLPLRRFYGVRQMSSLSLVGRYLKARGTHDRAELTQIEFCSYDQWDRQSMTLDLITKSFIFAWTTKAIIFVQISQHAVTRAFCG